MTTRKTGSRSRRRATIEDMDDSYAPSEERWQQLNMFGQFVVDDENGNPHRFRKGDIATILPSGKAPGSDIKPHEYWVGRILEIRADADSTTSNEIWAKVQWYYSTDDVAAVIPTFDVFACGKFERIWSDHWDFVAPQSFNEVIHMVKLYEFPAPIRTTKSIGVSKAKAQTSRESSERPREKLGDQCPIGPQTFFWRYTLEVQDGRLNPKPGTQICLCSKPYRPDATDNANVMHICPRINCGTAYHRGCLQNATATSISVNLHKRRKPSNSDEKNSGSNFGEVSARGLNLLCSSPDGDEDVDLIELVRAGSGSMEKVQGMLELIRRAYGREVLSMPQVNALEGQKWTDLGSRSAHMTDVGGETPGSVFEVEDLLVGDRRGESNGSSGKATVVFRRSAGLQHAPQSNNEQTAILRTRARTRAQSATTAQSRVNIPVRRLTKQRKGTTNSTPFSVVLSRRLANVHSESVAPQLTASALLTMLFLHPDPFTQEPLRSHVLLLALAQQPLLRGCPLVPAYQVTRMKSDFSRLGPTGNTLLVLRARRLVWNTLTSLAEVPQNIVNRHVDAQDGREDDRKMNLLRSHVLTSLRDWESKLLSDSTVVPQGQHVNLEDAIVEWPFPSRWLDLFSPDSGERVLEEDEDAVQAYGNGNNDDDDDEYSPTRRATSKRRKKGNKKETSIVVEQGTTQVDDSSVSSFVDWICPACERSI